MARWRAVLPVWLKSWPLHPLRPKVLSAKNPYEPVVVNNSEIF